MLSIAIVALLVALLLPALTSARNAGLKAACANNQRQIGSAWMLYVQDSKDVLPRHEERPDWYYGGVVFVGQSRAAVLDASRPLNRYIGNDDKRNEQTSTELTRIFRCDADIGVLASKASPSERRHQRSILPGGSCYREFGTSYRANPFLLDSTAAGIDQRRRPLALHEITVSTSRLLMSADATWYYATREAGQEGFGQDAGWHSPLGSGNMLAVDGSVRFMDFTQGPGSEFTLHPKAPMAPSK